MQHLHHCTAAAGAADVRVNPGYKRSPRIDMLAGTANRALGWSSRHEARYDSRFTLRQPPLRLFAMICLNMARKARAFIFSPWRIATVRAVLLL